MLGECQAGGDHKRGGDFCGGSLSFPVKGSSQLDVVDGRSSTVTVQTETIDSIGRMVE